MPFDDDELRQQLEEMQISGYVQRQQAVLLDAARHGAIAELRAKIKLRDAVLATFPAEDPKRSELDIEIAALREQLELLSPGASSARREAEAAPADVAGQREIVEQQIFARFKTDMAHAGLRITVDAMSRLMGYRSDRRVVERILRGDLNDRKYSRRAAEAFHRVVRMRPEQVRRKLLED